MEIAWVTVAYAFYELRCIPTTNIELLWSNKLYCIDRVRHMIGFYL